MAKRFADVWFLRLGGNLVEPIPIDVVAYHEAGHAVVALYYARGVTAISAGKPVPDESHVYHDPPRTVSNMRIDPENLADIWPLAVEDVFIECRISMGGPIAQAVYEGKSLRKINLGQDGDDFVSCLKYLDDVQRSVPILHNVDLSYKQDAFERLLLETTSVLKQRWVIVERLASELVKRRKLTGEDVVSIVYPNGTGKDTNKGHCCLHCQHYLRSHDGPIEEACIIDRKKDLNEHGQRFYFGDKHTEPSDFCNRFEMA